MSFEIGSLVVHPVAGFDLQQAYAELGPENIRRMVSGRGAKQVSYSRLRVTTSGSGWMPAGLASLARDQQFVLKCVAPRSIWADFSTRQATVPSKRRSDGRYMPYGYAVQADGSAVNSTISLAGNVATVAAVAGAVAYAVGYFPQITAWLKSPAEAGELGTATYRWELEAEEV